MRPANTGVPRPPTLYFPDGLDTGRLRLRRPRIGDGSALFDTYASDPEVTRFLRWRTKQSPSEMEVFVERACELWDQGAEYHSILEYPRGRAPIGMIAAIPGEHGVSLGYVLGRRYWGRGLMFEAARAVIETVRQSTGFYRVWAYTDTENAASVRLLERLGLTREALLRRWVVHPNISSEPRDACIYGLVIR